MIKIEIGRNAMLLANIIHNEGEVELETLKISCKLPLDVFYMALGWLSHECRIGFYKKDGTKIVFLL
jgi:hypothetical protein